MVDAEGASSGHRMACPVLPCATIFTAKGVSCALTQRLPCPRMPLHTEGGSIPVTPACPSGCMHGSRRRPSGAPAWCS